MNRLKLGLHQGALEVRQFMRSRESVVFTLLFPVVMIGIFGAIFTWEVAPGSGVRMTQYFVTGMIASGLMGTAFQNLAIWIPLERERGLLKRLRGTPMPPSTYFVGKVLMVFAIAVGETVVLMVFGSLLFGVRLPRSPERWLTFGWLSVLGIATFTLCGIAFSSLARSGRSGPAVATPVALVLQFISGVFFVYTALPGWMRQIAALFPLKWLCQGMRSVFLPDAFGAHEVAHSWELGKVALVLGAWCVGALVLCLLTFRWTDRRQG